MESCWSRYPVIIELIIAYDKNPVSGDTESLGVCGYSTNTIQLRNILASMKIPCVHAKSVVRPCNFFHAWYSKSTHSNF